VAILPLYRASGRPIRTLRFLGSGGAGQELGPICAPQDRLRAAAALRRALESEIWGWDLFLGDFLPGSEDWNTLTDARTIGSNASPRVRTEGLTWDAYMNRRSHKFRRTVRNFERRLSREWALSYRLSEQPDRIEGDMAALHELHERRWGGAPGAPDYRRISEFERELAPLALELGWLRLWTMELEGRPAVGLFGLRYGGTEWAIRIGRDPDPRRRNISVGLVLFAHAIRAAIEDGVGTYRLGRGTSEYKQRLADDDPGLVQIGVPRGLVGRLALGAARARDSLPGWSHRWLVEARRREQSQDRSR
jgi:CelD/BcsL family acetyltransferase involved in cellulose biosynthesis